MTMRVLLVALALLLAPAAVAAPEGFRKSDPLTKRAAALAWNQKITVHCASTLAVYRATGGGDVEEDDSLGRIHPATLEIELPPETCLPLERWLRGRPVSITVLAETLFTLGHEVGHAKLPDGDESDADCYASRKFNALAKLFGVRSAVTLKKLRIAAPLLDVCR